MALRKNKIELLDQTLSLRLELIEWHNEDYDPWSDSYYDYWNCQCWNPNCSCYNCNPELEYDYVPLPDDNRTKIFLSKRGLIRSISAPMIMGRLIDMNTIYSREVMREKKIDEILGITVKSPTTIGDIWSPLKK